VRVQLQTLQQTKELLSPAHSGDHQQEEEQGGYEVRVQVETQVRQLGSHKAMSHGHTGQLGTESTTDKPCQVY
jgi:hypothetical protein